MKRKIHIMAVDTLAFIIMALICSNGVYAQEASEKYSATRYGLSVVTGKSYHPTNNINFYMVSGFALYDYEKVWRHKAPEELLFKVEGSIGAAHDQKTRLVSSMNIFALYYLDMFKTSKLRPYIEGGIGVIYTDFQIRGQGLRLNFNPQLGIGTEFKTASDNSVFFALRLHHISNGNLDDDNVSIDSVMCMFGYYF
jgi:lipid A 3-O-deacylase